jgi:hypothetical protein
MKKNILGTMLLSLALSLGFKDEVKIKKASNIHKSWKDDQTKDEVDSALKKAILKRERKANRGRGFSR